MADIDLGNELSEGVKKIMLAGIGAMAVTAEKSKDIVDKLVHEGELTVDQGKVLNAELKRTVDQHAGKSTASSIADKMADMNADELEAIRAKLAEIDGKRADEAAASTEKSDDAAD